MSISLAKLDEIRAAFKTVHYHPDGQVPDDHLAEVDMWFTSWTGLPPNVTSLKQIPRTKVIRLSSGQCLSTAGSGPGGSPLMRYSRGQQLACERDHAVQGSKGANQNLLGIW